jgi:hypothetical protein
MKISCPNCGATWSMEEIDEQYCGASLQGTDAYDHQAGRYANPGQSAWLVHPKHGEFNRINFNL